MKANPKILVPTDFSASADAALEYAVDLAQQMKGSIVLMSAWELPTFAGPDLLVYGAGETRPSLSEYLRTSAHTALGERVDAIRARGFAEISPMLRNGSAVPEILDSAERINADLIVMGTHGRGAFAHAVLGSVAEKIVRLASVSVLIVHAPKKSAEAKGAA